MVNFLKLTDEEIVVLTIILDLRVLFNKFFNY